VLGFNCKQSEDIFSVNYVDEHNDEPTMHVIDKDAPEKVNNNKI